MGDAMTIIENNTSSTTVRVQRQYSLTSDVHGWHVESLTHYLCRVLLVGHGGEGSISQQDGVLIGSDSQLIVEGVMPDVLQFETIPNMMGVFST